MCGRLGRYARNLFAFALIALGANACSGGGKGVIPPQPAHIAGTGVLDESSQTCDVSYDGMVWYSVPTGSFSPIDVRQERCAAGALAANASPAIPAWAKPSGPTKAIFVATSLQEAYSLAGMQSIETAASATHTPVTWLIGNPLYFGNSSFYDSYHQANGDDVQVEHQLPLISAAESTFSWYRPAVSAEGAGHERDVAGALALGESAFWGIAWNQSAVDGTNDVGAPWGTYCADISSYKRPAPDGSCGMLAFEWTARDLDRAYLSGHSEYFSTDPDDLQQRAGFSAGGAATYVRALVDAYAAAGQTQPLVMVSQQESAENLNASDQTILTALYGQAAADGLRAETLTQAASDARTFSAAPRAIAFPYITGGTKTPAPLLGGGTLYPATIDYHDTIAGMTFLAGHTTPARLFRYADDPVSRYNVSFLPVGGQDLPTLTGVTVTASAIAFAFQAPVALHYGVALWTDPGSLGLNGQGVTPAGHAGVVLTFDLQPGVNQVTFACARCTGTTFPYST